MKNVKNTQENVNTMNEENKGMQAAPETNETLTPEQQKAAAILKARLPHLAEAGLNFEKRSGNFFRASLVSEQDENGYEVEKVRRLVVDLTHESEAKTVAKCADEMNAKRAAAMVLSGNKGRIRLEEEKAEAEKRLTECVSALATFDADMLNALEIVNAVELPERATATRATVTAKLANVQNENEKLRALLIAAGIDPDAAQ